MPPLSPCRHGNKMIRQEGNRVGDERPSMTCGLAANVGRQLEEVANTLMPSRLRRPWSPTVHENPRPTARGRWSRGPAFGSHQSGSRESIAAEKACLGRRASVTTDQAGLMSWTTNAREPAVPRTCQGRRYHSVKELALPSAVAGLRTMGRHRGINPHNTRCPRDQATETTTAAATMLPPRQRASRTRRCRQASASTGPTGARRLVVSSASASGQARVAKDPRQATPIRKGCRGCHCSHQACWTSRPGVA